MGEPSDDVELLRAIADHRDRDAFAALFRAWLPRVRAYTGRWTRDPARADELAQDVLLKVWRRAASYDPRYGAPSTWVFAIARNVCIDAHRRASRPTVDASDPTFVPDEPTPDDLAILVQHADRVADAIDRLPEAQATVVREAYFDGHTMREIAERNDLPLGTVKSRVRLALERLRALLSGKVDP